MTTNTDRLRSDLVALWIIDVKTGELTHGRGWPLPRFSGANGREARWLNESQSAVLSNRSEYGLIAFDNPDDAGKWLASREAHLRDQLSELYRTMQMVATEVYLHQRVKIDQAAAKGPTDDGATAPATAS